MNIANQWSRGPFFEELKSAWPCTRALWTAPLIVLCLTAAELPAQTLPGPNPWLDYWSFNDTTNYLTELGYAPLSFTNLAYSDLGNFYALVLDSTNAAWLRYKVTESSGTNNIVLDRGTAMFWFAPYWSGTNAGGSGPGDWGRLIEVGSYTTNASYGWWSLYLDPEGANLYFSGQTNNGSEATYLSASISWTTNYWHHLALTYTATNSLLFVDGLLAASGSGVAYRPGPSVLTNGFWIGSDSNGLAQARGMFDDLSTYDYPMDDKSIRATFLNEQAWYYLNPENFANLASAPSEPTNTPVFRAVTGPGYLISLGSNSTACVTSGNVWITNATATVETNETTTLIFTIAGGSNGVLYDVYGNALLDFSNTTNSPWAWMGQGYHCTTYTLTNLPLRAAFFMLGTPQDDDADGLPNAYELLRSKTRIDLWDTDGDGLGDGEEVGIYHTNPLTQDSDGDGVIDQPFRVLITRPRSNSGVP